MTPPRQVPDWNSYLMGLAWIAAARSKDPSTQHGCVLVNLRHEILSVGYNGMPAGIDDQQQDWGRPAKYELILHAEDNALANSQPFERGQVVAYVTGLPCARCMLRLGGAGVLTMIFGPQNTHSMPEEEQERSLRVAQKCGITLYQWHGDPSWLLAQAQKLVQACLDNKIIPT